MSVVDVSDPATLDAASARIGDLFAGQPMPASTAAAIAEAYAALGDDVPVAVRSSATAEDLPGLSAAGHDANHRRHRAISSRGSVPVEASVSPYGL